MAKDRGGVLELDVVVNNQHILTALVNHISLVAQGIRFAITWHTLIMSCIACFFTFICSKGMLEIQFNTSMSIVAVGTIFPLVFSVQASFQRREKALSCLAKLKGAMYTMYLMFKTWEKHPSGSWCWESDGVGAMTQEIENLFQKLLDDIEWYLRSSKHSEEAGNVVYDGFATLADKMKEFHIHAGYKYNGESGMGRMSVYFRDMISHFESVRTIRDVETPIGLRLFCFALIHTIPILLAPYWNHFCVKQHNWEIIENKYGCDAGYFICIIYVLIVITLYRVQSELEDPFDGRGADDIKWEFIRSQLDQMSNYGKTGRKRRTMIVDWEV
eukprot:758470-Hanusia_phi.AAC.3